MAQILKKFIGDNQVDGIKLRLLNGQMLRWRNAAGTADVDVLRVTSADKAEFQVLPEALATLPIPSAPKQFATIEYINNYLAGKIDAKDSVSYLADSDIAGTFSAGNATTAATLTGNTALVVDGKTFGPADVTTPRMRIALTGQTAGLQNGVYDLTAATASSFTLTRSRDFDGLENESGNEVTTGAYFMVTAGTMYAGYEALLTTPDPIVINTTSLNFVRYPSTLSLTAGDMLVKIGNDFSIDLAPLSGLESTNPGNANGQLRVKTDTATLEKDQTTRRDPTTGATVAKRSKKLTVTLTSTDITNQYIDLPDVAADSSVQLAIAGAGDQLEGDDFTVNYTGGTGSKTRVLFVGGLANGGVSALIAGDKVAVSYTAF